MDEDAKPGAGWKVQHYYWLHWSAFLDNGTFSIKYSEYTEDEHSTGFLSVEKDSPDFPLWQWLEQKHQNGDIEDILSGDDLEKWRSEFQQAK